MMQCVVSVSWSWRSSWKTFPHQSTLRWPVLNLQKSRAKRLSLLCLLTLLTMTTCRCWLTSSSTTSSLWVEVTSQLKIRSFTGRVCCNNRSAFFWWISSGHQIFVRFPFCLSGPDLCAFVTSWTLCPQNSQCINTLGSYSCVCKPGYYDVSSFVKPSVVHPVCNGKAVLCHVISAARDCLEPGQLAYLRLATILHPLFRHKETLRVSFYSFCCFLAILRVSCCSSKDAANLLRLVGLQHLKTH